MTGDVGEAEFTILCREYETVRIGSRISNLVLESAVSLLRRRDLTVYAEVATNPADAALDIAQSFIEKVLLGEGQIDYIFQVSNDSDAVKRLLQHHLRRFLAKQRKRTVVDNLFERCVELLTSSSDFKGSFESGFQLVGVTDQNTPVKASSVRRAAAIASQIPQLKSTAIHRNPRLFDQPRVRILLGILFKEAVGVITKADLQKFLQDLLTPWDFGRLDVNVNSLSEQTIVGTTVIDSDMFIHIVQQMEPSERFIFKAKYSGQPDREIANHLSISRSQATGLKSALWQKLVNEFAGVDERSHAEIIAGIYEMIVVEDYQ